jgi:hypothetical protein
VGRDAELLQQRLNDARVQLGAGHALELGVRLGARALR